MKKNSLLIIICALAFAACGNNDDQSKEDRIQTKDIARDGAIETALTTTHLGDSVDVVTTTHKIWKNNTLIKELVYHDTVPALGVNLNEGKPIKKEYEFYITVK